MYRLDRSFRRGIFEICVSDGSGSEENPEKFAPFVQQDSFRVIRQDRFQTRVSTGDLVCRCRDFDDFARGRALIPVALEIRFHHIENGTFRRSEHCLRLFG